MHFISISKITTSWNSSGFNSGKPLVMETHKPNPLLGLVIGN